MNVRLFVLRFYIPKIYKLRILMKLAALTGEAFESEIPDVASLQFEQLLQKYAGFTNEVAELPRTEIKARTISERLREGAIQLGSELRSMLNIRTRDEAMRALAILYRAIGINFRFDPQGNVIIDRCHFSTYYSSHTCRMISSLDRGIVIGLTGANDFSFTERITEGNRCCKAIIAFKEQQ